MTRSGAESEREDAAEAVLRPDRSLLRQGVFAVLALTVPIFAVLYWLTIPSGTWPTVLTANVVVAAVVLAGVYAYASASIRIESGSVTERGFFGSVTRIDAGDIGNVLLAEIYHGSLLETLPHLFVRDHEGALLLRMRGQFWSRESMLRVAGALESPVTTQATPMTFAQMSVENPHLLYWFERMPRLAPRLDQTSADVLIPNSEPSGGPEGNGANPSLR